MLIQLLEKTMNLLYKWVIIILLSSALIACSESGTDNPQTDEEIAQDLWQQLVDENYNSDWDRWPGTSGMYPPDTTLLGNDPHIGPQLFQTFMNSTAAAGINSKTFPLANKSIVVKENYVTSVSSTTLAAITVMLKKQGYDADNNDWFWVKYNPDGSIVANGKVAGCIGCHGQANSFHTDTDYLWTRIP